MVKTNSDVKSIRKKLMAAVAMLLVASIMVVSSSYAWFTLSTAPEVQGIATAVGSNGNLEMALRQNKTGEIQNTTSATNFPQANNFWGNLVDLSDDSYHLKEISLLPARLNAVIDTTTSVQEENAEGKLAWISVNGNAEHNLNPGVKYFAESPYDENDTPSYARTVYKLATGGYLQTPVYGTDGRLSGMNADTVNGVYDELKKAFMDNISNLGVRAVGITSNISPEALALRNAKKAVDTVINEGKANAVTSLQNDAVKLAQMFVAAELASLAGGGGGSATATYTSAQVEQIGITITNLQAIMADLENALKQAVVAVGVSQGETFTVDDVTFGADITVTVDGSVVTLDWNNTNEEDAIPNLSTAKDDLLTAYQKLSETKTALGTAQTKLEELGTKDQYTYTELKPVLTVLLDSDHFLVNGESVDKIKEKKDDLNYLLNFVANLTIQIKGGVYYTIAAFIGNYSGTTTMEIDVDGLGLPGFSGTVKPTVVMTTIASENDPGLSNGFYLPYVRGWMSSLTVGESTGADQLITDIYGYAIDLAFRTNAAGSSLQLQTEAANRVNDSEATMGFGSYMEFKVGQADYTVQQMVGLMKNIRVVFVDDEGSIYGIAALDVTLQDKIVDGAKVEATAESVFTRVETNGTETKVYEQELVDATLSEDGTTVKANLYLYDFTVNNGALELGSKRADSIITALQQNMMEDVSALVYLDGEKVQNADVAISGNSMSGTMNLQFSSTATLTPMDYTFQVEETDDSTTSSSEAGENTTSSENQG